MHIRVISVGLLVVLVAARILPPSRFPTSPPPSTSFKLYDNVMVEAGLADDPRKFVNRVNKILGLALKPQQQE